MRCFSMFYCMLAEKDKYYRERGPTWGQGRKYGRKYVFVFYVFMICRKLWVNALLFRRKMMIPWFIDWWTACFPICKFIINIVVLAGTRPRLEKSNSRPHVPLGASSLVPLQSKQLLKSFIQEKNTLFTNDS